MTILVEKRPEQSKLLVELRAMSSAYNYRRQYLELNPEVDSKNVVIYKYGRKEYPICEVWEIIESGT